METVRGSIRLRTRSDGGFYIELTHSADHRHGSVLIERADLDDLRHLLIEDLAGACDRLMPKADAAGLTFRAIAFIKRLSVGVGFRILACPAAPEHEGSDFAAPREVGYWRVGQYAVVKFCPDDQFAYECKEALQP